MEYAFGLIKALAFLVVSFAIVGIFASNKLAGRRSSKLVKKLNNGKLDPAEVARELYFTAGYKNVSHIPADTEIFEALSRIKHIESHSTSYQVKLLRPAGEGQFLFVVDCKYRELVTDSKEENRLAVFLFLLRANRQEMKYTVYSEVYEDLTDKLQREQFALELLSL